MLTTTRGDQGHSIGGSCWRILSEDHVEAARLSAPQLTCKGQLPTTAT